MSQAAVQIPTTSPLPGLSMVNDANGALATLATLASGASAPTAAGLGLAGTAGVLWHDTGNNLLKLRNQADTAWITLGAIDETTGVFSPAAAAHGECRLNYTNGTTLTLVPFNGQRLKINGISEVIPSAGVTLASSACAIGFNYIYAYMSGGTMTLMASTTGHTTDSETGVEVMGGDATKTFVGYAYVQAGPVFADSATQRLVLSHFNRERAYMLGGTLAAVATTSSSWVELSSVAEISCLVDGRTAIDIAAVCYADASGAAQLGVSVGEPGVGMIGPPSVGYIGVGSQDVPLTARATTGSGSVGAGLLVLTIYGNVQGGGSPTGYFTGALTGTVMR